MPDVKRPRTERHRESAVVARVRAIVTRYGGKIVKIRGGTTEVGTPDLFACVKGRCIVVECKAAGRSATPIQMRRLDQWEDAGAAAFVVTPDNIRFFTAWVAQLGAVAGAPRVKNLDSRATLGDSMQ